MGLAEKRAAKEFQEKRYPQLKQDIDAAAKFGVEVEVKWDQLATDDQAHLYDECWPKVYFKPLIEALKAITVDDLGREALQGALKKILIRNEGQISYGDRMAHFSTTEGLLVLDHKPTTNVDDVKDRTKGIQKTLEDAL